MKADGLKSGAISDHWVNNDRLSNHRMARTGHLYSFLGKTYPLRKGRFPEGKLESCAQNPSAISWRVIPEPIKPASSLFTRSLFDSARATANRPQFP